MVTIRARFLICLAARQVLTATHTTCSELEAVVGVLACFDSVSSSLPSWPVIRPGGATVCGAAEFSVGKMYARAKDTDEQTRDHDPQGEPEQIEQHGACYLGLTASIGGDNPGQK